MKYNSKDLTKMASTVRGAAIAALRGAASGHVGIVLGAADIITTVYANFMRRGVDRFVMSAGHGSALLYSILKLCGYNIQGLDTFRKIGGLPGHPEFGIDGVAATTGPLGQGVGNAVGIALAQKIGKKDGRVYCLCSDGDLMEGVAQESIAFAGIYGLNNLVLMWDDNRISIDGTALTDIDVPARMRAAGWNVLSVDGNNFDELNDALSAATRAKKATFIQCRTVIGLGSSVAGTSRAHGLGIDDAELGELAERFMSPDGELLWDAVAAGAVKTTDRPTWPVPDMAAVNVSFPTDEKISTRELSGKFISGMLAAGINLIGGSADLGHSTNAKTSQSRDITPKDFSGNYINYGVREHAMGAIMNGMASMGLRVYGSTFLVFSDYMRPSIRLAALSEFPVTYVFTHDSVAVGEDGPTHQPIEQLPSLRLMPNLNVFRPCNGAEVATAWTMAMSDVSRPSCIILSRQKIEMIQTPSSADIMRGGYVIYQSRGRRVRVTLIATGTEVPLAVAAAKKMGRGVRVVSMPSVGHFRTQPENYKRDILRGRVIAIEAAATPAWFEFADAIIGIDEFGASGRGADVYARFGFDTDTIVAEIRKKLKKL